MGSMILGRYIQGDSLIHRMDARAKIICSFYFVIVVFFANNWPSYIALLAYVFSVVHLSGVGILYVARGLRAMLGMLLFTVLFQLLFIGGGTEYFRWGFIVISQNGIQMAIFLFLRFVAIIFMTTALTVTTNPLELTDAIESLMHPLKKIKVPVHELALMLSIALRFVPTLSDEAQKIMNAQRSRGVVFDEGSLLKKVRSYVPILIPLFVSAFSRADELANAMEARGYRGSEGRTKYRQLTWRPFDTWAMVSCVVLTVVILLLRER